jgi:hypothetical protein
MSPKRERGWLGGWGGVFDAPELATWSIEDSAPATPIPFSQLTKFGTLFTLVMIAALLAGCGQKSGPIAQEQTNLSWLGSMYSMYIAQNGGRAPKSIDELRKFVETRSTPDVLTRLKIASMNELFVSPRDGKPFVLVSYAKLPAPTAGQPPPLVLYETAGQNGEHAVAFLGGGTQTVSATDLQKLLPPEKTGR